MDYEREWRNLRDGLYATLKRAIYIPDDTIQAYANVLLTMIDAEDKARGVKLSERHRWRLTEANTMTKADVIALYEAFDRTAPPDPDSAWVAAHLPALRAQYPGEWIAVLNGAVVAHGSPLPDDAPNGAYVEYIPKPGEEPE